MLEEEYEDKEDAARCDVLMDILKSKPQELDANIAKHSAAIDAKLLDRLQRRIDVSVEVNEVRACVRACHGCSSA